MSLNSEPVYSTTYSWWSWTSKLFYVSMAGAGGMALTLWLTQGSLIYELIFAVLLAAAYGVIYLYKNSLRINVTRDTLFIEVKLFSINSKAVNLNRIESVQANQTLIQRLLKYGDLAVTSGDEDFVLLGIRAPAKLKHAILEAAQGAVPTAS